MSRVKGSENKKRTRMAAGPRSGGFARTLSEGLGRLFWQFLPLLLIGAFLSGSSALLWWPVHAQDRTARSEKLTAAAIRNAVLQKERKPWISREDFEQAANLGLCVQNQSIFTPDLTRQLAAAYEKSPWVERVDSIAVQYPAQIDVQLTWRQPVACLDRAMVLDRQGVVLNLMADNPLVSGLPRLTGLSCPRTEAGRHVPVKDALDGLQLLGIVRQALTSSPGRLQVTVVQHEGAGTWRVFTDRGPVIDWGVFSDEPALEEPRTAEKVTLLQRRLRECGDPAGLEYIKVYVAQAPVLLRGAVAGSGKQEAGSGKQVAGSRKPVAGSR